MKSYFSFLRTNILALLIAYFLGRAGAIVVTLMVMFTPIASNFTTIIVIALALQGLLFALIYGAIRRYPINPLFCLLSIVVTVLAVAIGFALKVSLFSLVLDHPLALPALAWKLLFQALPLLTFLAQAATAMWAKAPPVPPAPGC